MIAPLARRGIENEKLKIEKWTVSLHANRFQFSIFHFQFRCAATGRDGRVA
ncbi:MAG TPA: hypothetical protein VNA69_20670 [Thermoanaerobaculia bacterium]|nr:hypothetical protein [Thermoanaerobaculia bacterium]